MRILRTRSIATAFILLIVIARPSGAQATGAAATGDSADSSEIAKARDRYVVATAIGDVEALTSLYAEDAVLVPTYGVVLRGKAEIAKYYSECFRKSVGARQVKINAFKTESKAGFGSETGHFEETETIAGGTAARVTGVYVTIYTRTREGRWLMSVDVRSQGNQPAPTPVAAAR